MQQTPFHAYYLARKLENLPAEEKLLPVFSSSDIEVYPFQVAAANFALNSGYKKGIVLCDEAGMGKSHEAMMIISQRWYEGKRHVLLCIPNADLLKQWVRLIDEHYTIPYVLMASNGDVFDNQNALEQDGIIITTYDFAVEHAEIFADITWDLTVFEEASALSSVYKNDNKNAKKLKMVANNSFKVLLTGTPIEKNILNLYGLIYFIDERILPTEKEFMRRYFRKPENYPELAEKVSKYCFRTLRFQAKRYAKLPNRIPVTYEYVLSQKEQELYDFLFAYCNEETKLAFPQMDKYDLVLRLMGIQGSSTAAILQTIKGIIKRLQSIPQAKYELQEFLKIERLAESIKTDSKTKALLIALKEGFKLLKHSGANQKVLIFTESVETQKYLYDKLKPLYQTVIYNGSVDYSALEQFKSNAQILISTDNGSRGFNLEECAFIVQYDLIYNALKMEQRIDRVHRLGQKNDVLVLSFIDKNNFADVRKLELINKRMLVADGVLGVSDNVIGGFTDDLNSAFKSLAKIVRTSDEIDLKYNDTLKHFEEENKRIVSEAEEVLFTTFTNKLAAKLKITPKYITNRAQDINDDLWQLVKWFFTERNATHDDCYFYIDEIERTVTAQNYEKLPVLFYYWSGNQNKKYYSLKSYGMAKDFKPHQGRITFTSIIGRGIISEIACADSGTIELKKSIEPCQIALYQVSGNSMDTPLLVGKTKSGQILKEKECESILNLPVSKYSQEGRTAPCWLRSSSKYDEMDSLLPMDIIIAKQSKILSEAQAEEVERIRLSATAKKSNICYEIDELMEDISKLEQDTDIISGDRIKLITLKRQLNLKKNELKQKQQIQSFEQMRTDVEYEQKIKEFLAKEKLCVNIIRQFIILLKN